MSIANVKVGFNDTVSVIKYRIDVYAFLFTENREDMLNPANNKLTDVLEEANKLFANGIIFLHYISWYLPTVLMQFSQLVGCMACHVLCLHDLLLLVCYVLSTFSEAGS